MPVASGVTRTTTIHDLDEAYTSQAGESKAGASPKDLSRK